MEEFHINGTIRIIMERRRPKRVLHFPVKKEVFRHNAAGRIISNLGRFPFSM
jgi:hypothetical protein